MEPPLFALKLLSPLRLIHAGPTYASESHITTDSQSASLSWCQAPIWVRHQFFFLLEIVFIQLRVCYFVAPSLTRGRVCNLLLLLVLASAVPLGSALSDEKSGLSFVSISI
jgi:hypothetical protein